MWHAREKFDESWEYVTEILEKFNFCFKGKDMSSQAMKIMKRIET